MRWHNSHDLSGTLLLVCLSYLALTQLTAGSEITEIKEIKEIKEIAEITEIKEIKESKEIKEIKEISFCSGISASLVAISENGRIRNESFSSFLRYQTASECVLISRTHSSATWEAEGAPRVHRCRSDSKIAGSMRKPCA